MLSYVCALIGISVEIVDVRLPQPTFPVFALAALAVESPRIDMFLGSTAWLLVTLALHPWRCELFR